MISRVIKYISLIFFSGLWLLGFSGDLAKWASNIGLSQDDYRYGDLYRFSNLPQFRIPKQECATPEQNKTGANISLYLIGDSFTEKERIDSTHFKAGKFQRFFIGDTSYIVLDTTKKNILIIETVERHLRERFAQPYVNLQIVPPASSGISSLKKETPSKFWYNTERHESLLFSSDFFLNFKEWKALLNYKLFNRVDDNVILSEDQKHIFYYKDAQPSGITSSFDKVSDLEINILVRNINFTYSFYKKVGFDEVYLTIAPNKTSILGNDLGEYNHLIERIQKNKSLEIPFFDVYTPFHRSNTLLYDIGDTHWNCKGKQIWIDYVNKQIQ